MPRNRQSRKQVGSGGALESWFVSLIQTLAVGLSIKAVMGIACFHIFNALFCPIRVRRHGKVQQVSLQGSASCNELFNSTIVTRSRPAFIPNAEASRVCPFPSQVVHSSQFACLHGCASVPDVMPVEQARPRLELNLQLAVVEVSSKLCNGSHKNNALICYVYFLINYV